jgi:putative ABC transport system permease protein
MIWKTTIREIKNTFGRFFAILAIIALGVGFFSGLKVTKQAMVETTGQYLEDLNFFDYHILSTMGFEQEDVEFLKGQEDVRDAEGIITFDFLYRNEAGEEGVVKAYSIGNKVNQVKVVSGRMPEQADECVVDCDLFGEDAIGSTICLSEHNESEDAEHFVYNEYKIVGIVQSPLYIQFERGNSKLGAGKVDGFICIPQDGFDVDYYTDIFVKFDSYYPLYSKDYNEFLKNKKDAWEEYAAQAADFRYQRILADAKAELDDAKNEFEEEKKDGWAKLVEAKTELDDAREQIIDGEEKLSSAQRDLNKAKNTVAQKEEELSDAEREIAEKEQEIQDNERKLDENASMISKSWKDIEEGKALLNAGRLQLEEQKQLLIAKEQELNALEASLGSTVSAGDISGGNMLAEGKAALLAAKAQV